MNENVEPLMLQILAQYEDDPVVREALAYHKECSLNKIAAENPLSNSMWSQMLEGALKAIEVVSMATFDYKLLVVVKLFQNWLAEKKAEKEQLQRDLTLGKNYDITHPNFTVTPSNPYGPGSYY